MSAATRSTDIAAEIVARLRATLGAPDDKLPLHEPSIGEHERALVDDCLMSGWVSSVGPYVDAFETRLAEMTGARHAVAVSSGTAGLHAALMVAGVGPDDEVLAPSLTFAATINAIAHCHAVPHFVEIDPATLAVDPEALAAHLADIITVRDGRPINRLTGRRLAALVPVHLFGFTARQRELQTVAERFDLPVIEDAAEALGTTLDDRAAGTFGRMGVLSFNGNKIVTSGGGGAILTNDAELARAAKHLTTTAKLPHPWRYDHDRVGYNYRLTNLSAALGVAQLDRLDEFVTAKRQLLAAYQASFADFADGRVMAERPGERANAWLTTLILADDSGAALEAALPACHAAGFLARPAWTPLHLSPMYRDCPRMSLPTTESMARRILNLPSSAALTQRLR